MNIGIFDNKKNLEEWKMKKKLTMINNIVCVLLMIALFATMLIPCWDFVAEEKVKVRVCRACV